MLLVPVFLRNLRVALVAYFSATRKTKKVAQRLADAYGAGICEIRPEILYTKKDLNWLNRKSRSAVEMNGRPFRPAIITGVIDIYGYDKIFLGFPIWWYTAPTIINTFLESCDFFGKKVVLFATSGSIGFGRTVAELQSSAPDAEFAEGMVISGAITETKLKTAVEFIKEV